MKPNTPPNIPIALVRRVLAARANLEAADHETHAAARSLQDAGENVVSLVDWRGAKARQEMAHMAEAEACRALVNAVLQGYGIALDADPDDLEVLLAATGRMVARPVSIPDSERIAGSTIDRIVAEIRGWR